LKLRIKINEDSRIEPVTNEFDEEINGIPEDEEEADLEEESFESGEENEILEEMSEETDEMEEEKLSEEPDDKEGRFQDQLDLAQSEFEDINDDDESFLQSLREQKKNTERSDGDNREMQDESEEEKTYTQKKSEWPVYMKETRDDGSPVKNYEGKEQRPTMDLAELLEHKDMTKIIETIFDYDFEDFANTLDEISNCKNEDDAQIVINETLLNRHISRTSKEAESFRSIISEYFNSK